MQEKYTLNMVFGGLFIGLPMNQLLESEQNPKAAELPSKGLDADTSMGICITVNNLGCVKRIWYLSPMRAAKVQASHLNLCCSLIQAVSQEEPSDKKPDPWPLWMAGHVQLKFVMKECSKTQICLARHTLFPHVLYFAISTCLQRLNLPCVMFSCIKSRSANV